MPKFDIVTKTTEDSKETVKVQALPLTHDDQGYQLDGYDWMETLAGDWIPLPSWGQDGWDAGSWPYIIIAVSKTTDEIGPVFGLGTYCEGDLSTRYYRDHATFWQAITTECAFHWRSGQADGPKDLPPEGQPIPEKYSIPYDLADDSGDSTD